MGWKMAAVILSLGVDNFMMSVALGASNVRSKLRLCLVFALFEGIMPLIGFALGQSFGGLIGDWGFIVGLVLIAGLGLYMLIEDDDDERSIKDGLKGTALLLAGIGVSLDEAAVGFSFGMLGFPILWTCLLIFVQAFVLAFIGLAFGTRLKPLLGEAAEKIAGIVLLAVAVWMALEKWLL